MKKLLILTTVSLGFWLHGKAQTDVINILPNGGVGINSGTIPAESSLLIGEEGGAEGGQIQLNPSVTGGYTSAYFIDVYGNSMRILRGTTAATSNTIIGLDNSDQVNIGTAIPAARFTVGNSNQFRVSSSGDLIRINDIAYTWPAVHASGALINNGTGGLSWGNGSSLFTAGNGLSWSGSTLNSVWTVNGTHIYNNNSGNVGIGSAAPGFKLDVFGDARVGETAARHYLKISSSSYGEIRYANATYNEEIRLGLADGGSYGANNGDWYVYASPVNRMDLIMPRTGGVILANAGGNVGIGTTAPVSKLDVRGIATINNNNNYANVNNFMASGTLTVGGITTNFGGGSGWTSNTAGILMETLDNTEIGIHDSGTRVASAMYFQGAGVNRITIGRDMGWGTTPLAVATLAGSGTRFVLADANGILTAGSSTSSGIITGSGTLNYIPKWTPDGARFGNSLMYDNGTAVGIGTTSPIGKFHVAGSHANGVMVDGNDRPSIAATGNYPQMVLMAGVANGNHGATLMLGGYDSGTSGNHKHWSIGTAGNGATFLDIGYHAGTDLNPHAGIRNYSGTTYMTILNNGNVGLTNTAPAAKLQVSGGAIRPEQGNASAAGINWGADIFGGGGDQAWIRYYSEGGENTRLVIGNENDADDEIGFYQTGAERMTIYNGNVGIGSSGPIQKLDVAGAIRSTDYHYINNNNPTIIFQDTDQRSGVIHINSNLMYFLSGSGVNGTGWTINGSYWPLHLNMTNDEATFGGAAYFMEGNVGIGTSAPVDRLDVRSAMSVNEIKFRNLDGGDDSDPYRLRKYQVSGNTNELRLDLNDDPQEQFTIYGNSCASYGCGEYSGNLYHFFRADGTTYHLGNMGIGNTAPASKLHVGGIPSGGGILIGNYNDQLGWNGSGGLPYFAIRFAGYRDVVSNFTGAMISGVRTNLCCSGLSQAMDMSFFVQPNTATVSGDGNLVERFRVDGAGVRSTAYNALSDIRLKSNIEEIDYGLKDILKMNPVSYTQVMPKSFRADSALTGDKIESFGFIAQDLFEIVPGLVSKPEDPLNYWAVDYSKLTPILVKAIQEQQKEIEELKSVNTNSYENAQLKSEISDLKKMVIELEKKVNTK
ncbi:MAG: tail fiber domain-containing protein [Bacteroidia bacterium]